MIATPKIATAVAASVLGLAVTGAAAFAAFEPATPTSTTATITTETTAPQTDKEGAHDRVKDVLDKLVQNGTISQPQEDAILAALKSAHKDNDGRGGALHRVLAGLMKMSADYLGMSPKDLHAALKSGKSLAQIAVDQGKTRDGLVATLTTGASAEIDKLAAAGTITAEQATKIKAELPARIAKFVDHTFKPKASN